MNHPPSWAVERCYVDAFGRRHEVASDDIDRIARILGGTEGAGSHGSASITHSKAYQPGFVAAGRRLWVLAVQLYSIRSRRNWGHGDFTDLKHLLELAAHIGAAGVGINPLHALPPGQTSPYSPSSRLFLNPLYIDLDAVPEFRKTDAVRNSLEELRSRALVDYPRVAAIKADALRQTYRRFCDNADQARRNAFVAFRVERGEALERYAAFEVLKARYGLPWSQWPTEWQCPNAARLGELRASSDEMEFHEFVQWLADDQLRACRDRARELNLPVGLYLDLAVGVEPDGADAWVGQGALTSGLVIGAPPDAWNPAGQNWGIASFRPQTLIDTNFALLRQTLRAVMRYAGAIRIDHALGLNRLFMIPQGLGACHGAYVRLPFHAMLDVVAHESVAARCLVIGEDLGTVPEDVSETLRAWGVWSYRVALFERSHDGAFRNPQDYPADAIVTFTTHDLPTFAGWLRGHDLEVKAAIGIDAGDAAQDRAQATQALRDAVCRNGITVQATLSFANVARFIARTPCRLLSVAIDDVLGVADQINVPGTVNEYQNWMRRMPIDLEELWEDEDIRRLAVDLAAEGRATN